MGEKYDGIWPLPGGVEKYFETALYMLGYVREHQPTETLLLDEIKHRYSIDGSDAIKGYIRVLRSVGWIELQGQKLTPTIRGDVILRTRDSEQAFRDLDEAFSGVQETLDLIRSGLDDIEQLREKLNQKLGKNWSSNNQTFFRVSWLRSLGLVHRNEAGRLVATLGKTAFATSSEVHKPEEPLKNTQSEVNLGALIERLRNSAIAGGTGAELEAAVGDAFRDLGFEVVAIGGAGDTDLVARGRRGVSPVVVVIDAKSRASGKVTDNDINWVALRDHRRKNGASATIVVGPQFADGNVRTHAKEEGVRLLAVDDLVKLLEEHRSTPLGMDTLADGVFTGGGYFGDAEWSSLMIQVAERGDRVDAVVEVFDAIWNHQTHEASIDQNGLYYILGSRVDLDDIKGAIDFLLLPVVGAIERASSGGLRTCCSPKVLAARLSRLAERFRRE